MSRSKALGAGAALFAGALAATVAISGPAYAGGPSNATYDCKTSVGIAYTGVTGTFSTNSSHQLSVSIAIAPLISISNGDLNTQIKLNGPSGAVTFSGTNGTSGMFGPVNIGPLPKTAGTVSAGNTLSTITSSSAPSSSNWSIKMVHKNGVEIWCVGKSGFSPALTY